MSLISKHILCIVCMITILHSSLSQTVKSLTNSVQIQNVIQTKTICAFEMKDLYDYETIVCPINYKINIVNATLFDSSRNLTQCLPMTKNDKFIKVIKNELEKMCVDFICSISKSFLLNLLLGTPVINNLSLDIYWQCFINLTTNSVSNTPPATYSFTYFFYIVTLVLSTSCILIGAIFILRKFLVLRRRNRGYLNARTNRGFVSSGINNLNGTMSSNNIVWMTACPPPAYENIYDSSYSVNRLPDYNSTILKTKIQKENESILSANPSQQQQQHLQSQQEQTEQPQDNSPQQEHLDLTSNDPSVQISNTAIDSNSISNDNSKQQELK